jgi:hypothetical protein
VASRQLPRGQHSKLRARGGPFLPLRAYLEKRDVAARDHTARFSGSSDTRERRAQMRRFAMTRAEAARALGMSINSFERHVQPELKIVRRGKLRLIPVRQIEQEARACSTPTSNAVGGVPGEGALHVRCTALHKSGLFWGREGPTGADERAKSKRQMPAKSATSAEGRDSNPRWTVRPTTVFETAPKRPQCRITPGACVPGECRGE